jgi:hypothetical protein
VRGEVERVGAQLCGHQAEAQARLEPLGTAAAGRRESVRNGVAVGLSARNSIVPTPVAQERQMAKPLDWVASPNSTASNRTQSPSPSAMPWPPEAAGSANVCTPCWASNDSASIREPKVRGAGAAEAAGAARTRAARNAGPATDNRRTGTRCLMPIIVSALIDQMGVVSPTGTGRATSKEPAVIRGAVALSR